MRNTTSEDKSAADKSDTDVKININEAHGRNNGKNQFTSVSMKQRSSGNLKKSVVPERASPESPEAVADEEAEQV